MRFAVNNLKAKDSKVQVLLAASFPTLQWCIFQDKFYFNFYIQWFVGPHRGVSAEWKTSWNFPPGCSF